MKLRLDPWPADYDAPIQIDDEPASARVDATIEGTAWTAIAPPRDVAPCCYFVDGVLRVEARVLFGEGAAFAHGLLGSVAAGVVRSDRPEAAFGEIRVDRYLILGKGESRALRLAIGNAAIDYLPHAMQTNSPKDAMAQLQALMRAAEFRMASSIADDGCVFVDGLSYRAVGDHPVVGVVKRMMERYLGDDEFALVERLLPGERTPLFAILDDKYERYSAYLRLAMPRAIDHPLAGVVRLEIGGSIGLDRARTLAGTAAALLPRFASTPMRDPRAPQNLLPVGALESEMRRRLGDAVSIRRAIERALHEGH